jgi:hypothetical protein
VNKNILAPETKVLQWTPPPSNIEILPKTAAITLNKFCFFMQIFAVIKTTQVSSSGKWLCPQGNPKEKC